MNIFRLMREYLISKDFEDHGMYGHSTISRQAERTTGSNPDSLFSVMGTKGDDTVYINGRDGLMRIIINGNAGPTINVGDPEGLTIFDKFLDENVNKVCSYPPKTE